MATLATFKKYVFPVQDALMKTGTITIKGVRDDQFEFLVEQMASRGWKYLEQKDYGVDSGKTRRVVKEEEIDDKFSYLKERVTTYHDEKVLTNVTDITFERDFCLNEEKESLEMEIINLLKKKQKLEAHNKVSYEQHQSNINKTTSGSIGRFLFGVAGVLGLFGFLSLFWLFGEAIPNKQYYAIAVPAISIPLAILFLILGFKLNERADAKLRKIGAGSSNFVNEYREIELIKGKINEKLALWS